MALHELSRLLQKVQKPARYIGGELGAVVKQPSPAMVRFAFCFPDLYEVGMSHLGMKILYSLLNAEPDIWCERVFAPDVDMETAMRRAGVPLYGLESFDPLSVFDIIGFTLQYELSYTAILNMLDLSGIPVRAKDRTSLSPLIVAGGPCACNPEPLSDFIDLFILGEGEEIELELVTLYRQARDAGMSKKDFLMRASGIQGIYVPSLYTPVYDDQGKISELKVETGAPKTVTKRVVADLDKMFSPQNFIVPFIEIVHDRAMVELFRGCIRGCRFCQAGFTYRPIREKSPERLASDAVCLCDSTGYDEVSLSSLSTSDYTGLEPLMDKLQDWADSQKISLSLPSLRVDGFSPALLEKVQRIRKTGLTFAPEAGSQRLRDAINKNVTEEEVLGTCRTAFEAGNTAVKLYFMMGLPTETMEDIEAIATLAQKVVDLYYSLPGKPKGKGVTVTISVACFVPKPFTPFQFAPQDSIVQLEEKQKHLLRSVRSKKITVHYHDAVTSFLEAVLARGDRRLCNAVELAWKKGSRLDGWNEHFSMRRWTEAFAETGVEPNFYTARKREYDEILPWDHLDYGVDKSYFIDENEKATEAVTTSHCRLGCNGCGADRLTGGICI